VDRTENIKRTLAQSDLSTLLSLLLYLPTPDVVRDVYSDALATDVRELLEELAIPEKIRASLVAAFAEMVDSPTNSAQSTPDEQPAERLSLLRREYTRLFTHPTHPVLAINESLFCYDPAKDGPIKPVAFINATAVDVDRFYRQAGYQASSTIQLPADHAACELGFLAYLLQIKVKALQDNDLTLAEESQSIIEDFSRRHLTNWMDLFFAEVEQASNPGLFRALGALGIEFINLLNREVSPVEGDK
jgi:TorA maturation chaperone TorD